MDCPRNTADFQITSSLFLPETENVRLVSEDNSFRSRDVSKNISREMKPGSAYFPSSLSFDAQVFNTTLEKREQLDPPVLASSRQSTDLPIKEYTIEEQKQAFAKQVAKIKYFWRGTNFNYPYAFHKFLWPERKSVINNKKNAFRKLSDSDYSEEENNGEDCLILIEDYSNKMVNPAEKIFR